MLSFFSCSKTAAQMPYFKILPTLEHKADPERFASFLQGLLDTGNEWYRFLLLIENGLGTIYLGCPPVPAAERALISALKTACPDVEALPCEENPTAGWPAGPAAELVPASDILPFDFANPEVFAAVAQVLGLGRNDGNRAAFDVCFDPLSPRKESALKEKAAREAAGLLGTEPPRGGLASLVERLERELKPGAFSLHPGRARQGKPPQPARPQIRPDQRNAALAVLKRFEKGRFFRAVVRFSAHSAHPKMAKSLVGAAANVLARAASPHGNRFVASGALGAPDRLRKGVLGPWDGRPVSSLELAYLIAIPTTESQVGRSIEHISSRTAPPPLEMLGEE